MDSQKLLKKILNNQKNVRFRDMIIIVNAFGFSCTRISGSHYIFQRDDIPELINLQNVNGEAKPYQIKQFLKLIEKYNINLGD